MRAPQLRPLSAPARHPLSRTALAAACAWVCGHSALAQTQADDVLLLKPSLLLQDKLSPEQAKQQPTFASGQTLTGRPDIDMILEGEAEIRRAGTLIRADRIEYYQPDDRVRATGNVKVNREGNRYSGPALELRIDANEGSFVTPAFDLLKNGAVGSASRVDFVDDKRSTLRDVLYSTCRPEDQKDPKKEPFRPAWQLAATQLRIDDDTEEGQASGAVLRFQGVPILATPFLTFPTSSNRRSGWLPPTFNIDNVSGFEVMVPYYWNLAPNRDATLYTSVMTKRGVNAGAEFRYLESRYKGTARLDWMPQDKLRNSTRWGVSANHSGTVFSGLQSVGDLSVTANVNRVSDNNYWRDFPRAVSALTSRLLSNDLSLSWSRSYYSLTARTQKWQTLQDPGSQITPPYDQLPQITGRYTRSNHQGFDYQLSLDTTRYKSNALLTGQPNVQRSYASAQLSYPWITPGSFVKPKISLHTSHYDFDTPLATGAFAGSRTASRTLPTFSVDSGLIFERDYSLFGRAFTQTLEPRAFYTYTPYRDQTGLPLYDSGATDFNFTSIYNENAFTGNDRISDNNLLTLGVTSRFITAVGAESLRLNFAQRLRLRDQRVTLPGGVPDTQRVSDQLLGATVNWSPQWTLDTTLQYSPQVNKSQRTTLSARYSPSLYRTISTNYVFNRASNSRQVDLGWQWPINDLWGDKGRNLGAGLGQGPGRYYSVGRLNYSMIDKKLIDTVVGIEYDDGCWLGRVVLEKLQTTSTTANKRIMFQLELVGFGRVGNNPLTALRTYVPRYQLLREKITTSPSRFSTYE
jgi:LPS-assembly protein